MCFLIGKEQGFHLLHCQRPLLAVSNDTFYVILMLAAAAQISRQWNLFVSEGSFAIFFPSTGMYDCVTYSQKYHHLNSSAEKWPSIPDTWDSLFLTSLRKAFGTETCVWKSKPKISWMLVLPQSTLVNISNFLYTFSGAFTCYHLSFDRPEKAISYLKAIS